MLRTRILLPIPLHTASLELRALATQAALLFRSVRAPTQVHGASDARRAVVLVHGFLAAPAFLAPLADHLRSELGEPVHAYGYGSHLSFESVLEGLATFVEGAVPPGGSVALVGHSLGGIVCRAYAQETSAARPIDRLVTIACPHDGTRIARALPTSLGRALRPDSEHIVRLAEGDARLQAIPHTDIVAEFDHFVAASSAPTRARHGRHVVRGASHNAVLYDALTHRLVADALR